ncbi:MAG TPA: SRPBCC family protein [Calidithermus sp.]|nr:SRPBCC family protein [Calidithermus sp.]
MNRAMTMLTAAGVGAAVMYLLDPDRGNRRRALIRDKLVSARRRAGDAAQVTARDMANRARGGVAELTSWIARRPPSDDVLTERVRSRLGFLVSHPGSIDVAVRDGWVTLSGPVLADEVDQLLTGVSRVRGVRGIDNRLEVHREPGNVPGLQGPARRPRGGAVFPFMPTVWSPSARFVAGLAGGGLALLGARVGGLVGAAAGLGGLTLLTRAVTNLELTRLTGIGAGRRAVVLHKTITVQAPVDEVFAFWRRYENFARFMSHVREIRRGAEGRAHWVVAGPAGLPVEFDTEETRVVDNELIAWRTVPGSLVEHAGIVRFQSTEDGRTKVDVRLSYNPVAGAVGHAVAALFGADPKQAMDDDLIRFKSLIEAGKATARGQTVTRQDIGR